MSLVFRLHNAYYHVKRFGFNPRTLAFLARSRYGRSGGAVSFTPKGYAHPVYVRKHTSDLPVFDQVMLAREYEIPLDFTPETIVDCGANIGLTTVYWKNRFPDVKIVCVEPEDGNYAMLARNTACYRDVHLLKAGLWPADTNLVIENPEGSCYGFRVRESAGQCPGSIRAVTVRSIMDDFGLSSIDILKIDIEGSEKDVFGGDCGEWLPRVRVLVVELHDRTRSGCSQAVVRALAPYRFDMEIRGENLVFYMK